MLTVNQVAGWFLIHANKMTDNESDVSNMKLQKLMYYAQGHSLGVLGRPLCLDTFEAWEHGPVLRSLYLNYSDSHGIPLIASKTDEAAYTVVEKDPEVRCLLERVWGYYGHKSAWALRNATNNEEPWMKNFVKDSKVTIPTKDIQEYFKSEYNSTKFDNYVDREFAEKLSAWLS